MRGLEHTSLSEVGSGECRGCMGVLEKYDKSDTGVRWREHVMQISIVMQIFLLFSDQVFWGELLEGALICSPPCG